MTKKANNNQKSSSKMKEWVEKTKKRFTVDWFDDEDEQKNRKHYIMTEKARNKQDSQNKTKDLFEEKKKRWTVISFEDEDEQKQ